MKSTKIPDIAGSNGVVNKIQEPILHDNKVKEAHLQADLDIENDPDFKPHPKTHDLDEGELARLGDE